MAVLLGALLVPLMPRVVHAQGSVGTVTGRIVDSETLKPLDRAGVELHPVRFEGPGGSAAATSASVTTDSLGEYRFERVRAGTYRLVVRRIGYMPRVVEVDLRQAGSTLLSLGLQVDPVLLPPVRVLADVPQPYSRTSGGAQDAPSATAEVLRVRQETHLVGDVRELTHADVVEAVTLAESDVFRALQRTPGVTTRDDYTATLWTRGATWDQTRVYFDGMPLFNPTHAGWLFSAINPDALGGVSFFPGVRSSRWGEGASAVLDLRSRAGGEGGAELRGRGEMSLASARLALDGQVLDGRIGWMIAGRRTYVDVVSAVTGALRGRDEDYLPYDFDDLIGRIDGRIGRGWSYTFSGILERDNLRGDVPGLLKNNQGEWGNRSGQLTVRFPLGPLQASVRTGQTEFNAAIRQRRGETAPRRGDRTLPPLETKIDHRGMAVELHPRARGSAPPVWSVGYQSVRDSVGYRGPFPLINELAVVLPRDTSQINRLVLRSGLAYQAFWGERRFHVGSRLSMDAGWRVEVGDSVVNGGKVRHAPRLAARMEGPGGTLFSAGWARSYQYTHDIAPVAGPLGPQLHLTHLWVQAQPRGGYPAVQADVSTVGVERWFGPDWLLSANGYDRRASGVVIPNPVGERVTPDRDPDVVADNRAQGLELSARRFAERWTLSAGYAYGVSRMYVDDLIGRDTVRTSYPSVADVRHAVDLSGLAWVGKGVRVGGAYTFGSGVPYTQLILPSGPGAVVELGGANLERTRSYASLDLTVDYTTEVRNWQVTGYMQLRNALNRDNRITYTGSHRCSEDQPEPDHSNSCVASGGVHDHFVAGIPRLPLFGVRVSF